MNLGITLCNQGAISVYLSTGKAHLSTDEHNLAAACTPYIWYYSKVAGHTCWHDIVHAAGNATMPDKRYLSSTETARHLRLSNSWLAKSRLTGDGPPYIKAGRSVLYDLEDLEEWMNTRKRRSTSDTGDQAA